jgi:hypothetical protein
MQCAPLPHIQNSERGCERVIDSKLRFTTDLSNVATLPTQHCRGLRMGKRATSRPHVTHAAVQRATVSNKVWSSDISWLPTTVRGLYPHLYLVMDV